MSNLSPTRQTYRFACVVEPKQEPRSPGEPRKFNAIIRAADLPRFPLDPNARQATKNPEAVRDMLVTLATNPLWFRDLNGGAAIIADNVVVRGKELGLTILGPSEGFLGGGIGDGGHTAEVLWTMMASQDPKFDLAKKIATVRLEIFQTRDNRYIEELVRARNTRTKVPKFAIAGLGNGRYQALREAMPGDTADYIAWKPGGPSKSSWDVQDLICAVGSLDRARFDPDDDRHPIGACSSKGSFVKQYAKEEDLARLAKLVAEVLVLIELIYSEWEHANGERCRGDLSHLGVITRSSIVDRNSPTVLPSGRTVPFRLANSYLYPAIGALRPFVEANGSLRDSAAELWGPIGVGAGRRIIEKLYQKWVESNGKSGEKVGKDSGTWAATVNAARRFWGAYAE